ncbi:unnamed protein product [Alternaria sp. RS040]
MAPPTIATRRQTIQANQPPQDGVQAARGMLQEPDHMRNVRSRIQEATSALQSELLQQLEVLNKDRAAIRATLTAEADAQAAEIKMLAAELKTAAADKKTSVMDLYSEKMRNKKVEQALTAEVKTLAAKLKLSTAKEERLDADLYNEKMRNKKVEQDLKKSEQALKEERAWRSANDDAEQKLKEIKAILEK